MNWLQKTLKQFYTLSIDTQALIISLILVITSLSFLFLLNRNNLSIKETNASLLEAQSILEGRITLPKRVFDSAFYRGQSLNIFQPGQTIFFLVHIIAAGGDGGVGLFQVELFLIFVLTVFFFSMAI